MGNTLYIIEASQKLQSLSDALIGDFPVQRFSSLASFAQLVQNAAAALVLVDCDDIQIEAQYFAQVRHTLLLLCGKESKQLSESLRAEGFATDSLPNSLEQPSLSRTIRGYLQHSLGHAQGNKHSYSYKDISLDFEELQLSILPNKGATLLTTKEAKLLKLLLQSPAELLSRARITGAVWGKTSISPRTLDSQVSRLRKRLQGSEVVIECTYGDGYLLR